MPGHKRTKRQRQEDLVVIAEMCASGMSQREIADHFGLSQPQICHDLKKVYELWSEQDKRKLTFIKNKVLAEISANKKEMRKAWRDSLKPKEKSSQKRISASAGVQGAENEQPAADRERSEVGLVTEDPHPNVPAMREVREYIKLECEIYGLINRKVEIGGDDNAPPIRIINVHEPKDVVRDKQTTSTAQPENAVHSPQVQEPQQESNVDDKLPPIPRFEKPCKPSHSDSQPPTT